MALEGTDGNNLFINDEQTLAFMDSYWGRGGVLGSHCVDYEIWLHSGGSSLCRSRSDCSGDQELHHHLVTAVSKPGAGIILDTFKHPVTTTGNSDPLEPP